MKGSLTPLGDQRWRLRVYVGTVGGRPIQHSRNFRGPKRAAQTALARMVAELDGRQLRPEKITVGALLDRWLERLECTPQTRQTYGYLLERVKPELGKMRLAAVTPRVLDDVYHRWLTEGATADAVRKRHTLLAGCFHQAVKWRLLTVSPTDLATPPRARSRQVDRVITVDEVRALVRAAEEDDPLLGCAVALAALTGCRRGELCALRWSHWVHGENILIVESSITALADGTVSVGPTKTSQRRQIALDPVADSVLVRRLQYQYDFANWAGEPLVADPWLLSRRADGGAPCLPDGLTRGFRRVARRLGYPYHLHELRHFAASMMIAGGVDPNTAATRLGHSKVTMTLNVYGHGVKGADRRAAELLGGLLELERETE